MTKRVLIVNSNPAVAFGLACLSQRAGLEVAGLAPDLDAAVGMAAATQPDIGLLEADVAQTPGLERLIEAAAACRFVLTAGRSEPSLAPPSTGFDWTPLSDEPIMDVLQQVKAEAPPADWLRPAA